MGYYSTVSSRRMFGPYGPTKPNDGCISYRFVLADDAPEGLERVFTYLVPAKEAHETDDPLEAIRVCLSYARTILVQEERERFEATADFLGKTQFRDKRERLYLQWSSLIEQANEVKAQMGAVALLADAEADARRESEE